MADENGAPVETPQEPQEPQEPQGPTEPQEPAEPQTPEQLTADQVAEKVFQRFASWQGKRDQTLMERMGQMVEERVAQRPPAEKAEEVSVFDDPDGWFQKKYTTYQQQQTQMTQKFNQDVLNTAGQIMDSDPLFQDEKLGKEVVEEIKQSFQTIDRNVPANVAGRLLVNEAVKNVYTKRRQTKTNPFEGKQPPKGPLGTVTPPSGQTPPVKPKKLDDMTAKLAKRWGYTEDQLAKLFPEE